MPGMIFRPFWGHLCCYFRRPMRQRMRWNLRLAAPEVDAEDGDVPERGSTNVYQVPILGFFRMLRRWGWVKTLVPNVNPKIAGKWMFIPLKMYRYWPIPRWPDDAVAPFILTEDLRADRWSDSVRRCLALQVWLKWTWPLVMTNITIENHNF